MKHGRVRVGKTNAAILSGEADLTIWSDEELLRGQKRSKNGNWTGRPPAVVPTRLHDELVRRKMSAAHDLLRDNLVAATEVLVKLATDKKVDDSVRLKAATIILDRVLGKAPERVELNSAKPWEIALQAGVVSLSQHANAVSDDD